MMNEWVIRAEVQISPAWRPVGTFVFLDFLKIQVCRNAFGGQWQLTPFCAFCGIRLGAAPGATVGTILLDPERKAVMHLCRPRFERVQRNSVARLASLTQSGSKEILATVVPTFMVRCSAGDRPLAPSESLSEALQ
jgi:hypothetical protein